MPSSPVLTVVDSENGSGAVATIAGSTVGSTNTVRVQLDGTTTWASAGSRAGDGAVNLTLAKGYYWAKCDSVVGAESAVSNVARLPITDAVDSVHGRSADAIRAAIIALSLPEIGSRVYRQMLPTETVVQMPCVVVWFNDAEQVLGGSNNRDDVGYLVHVGIMDRKLTSPAVMPDKYLSWRQRIMRKVRFQRMTNVPEVYTVQPQPEKVIDEKYPAYDFLVTAMTFICVSREVRG